MYEYCSVMSSSHILIYLGNLSLLAHEEPSHSFLYLKKSIRFYCRDKPSFIYSPFLNHRHLVFSVFHYCKQGCRKQLCMWIISHAWVYLWGFPGGSDGKESACNVRDLGSNPGQKDPLEKGMTTHSSILAWRKSHGQRSLLGSQSWSMALGRCFWKWNCSATMQL